MFKEIYCKLVGFGLLRPLEEVKAEQLRIKEQQMKGAYKERQSIIRDLEKLRKKYEVFWSPTNKL